MYWNAQLRRRQSGDDEDDDDDDNTVSVRNFQIGLQVCNIHTKRIRNHTPHYQNTTHFWVPTNSYLLYMIGFGSLLVKYNCRFRASFYGLLSYSLFAFVCLCVFVCMSRCMCRFKSECISYSFTASVTHYILEHLLIDWKTIVYFQKFNYLFENDFILGKFDSFYYFCNYFPPKNRNTLHSYHHRIERLNLKH